MIVQPLAIYTSVSNFALCSVGSLGGSFLLFRFEPHDVDRGGVKMSLDVRPIVFLNPLDASAGSFSQSGRCPRRPLRQAWIAAGIGVGLFLSVAIWLGSLQGEVSCVIANFSFGAIEANSTEENSTQR
jgi:hypothetical protein